MERIFKRRFLFGLLSGCITSILCFSQTSSRNLTGSHFTDNKETVSQVNPFIGTTKSASVTRWGNEGGIYPGAVAPWGFVQLSPETRVGDSRGYDYSDSSIYYFSCFHHASGFPGGSAGGFFLMPVGIIAGRMSNPGNPDANDTFRLGQYRRPFLHKTEQAEPGYYSVSFADDSTRVEATATMRTGTFRFHFPAGVQPRIFVGGVGALFAKSDRIFDTDEGRSAVGPSGADGGDRSAGVQNGVSDGRRRRRAGISACVQFSENVTGQHATQGGFVLNFASVANRETIILLTLSVSTVSAESAENNIRVEAGGKTFEALRSATRAEWEKRLSVVSVDDDPSKNKTVFYTALYHSLLLPWVVSDANGEYGGSDGKIHTVKGKNEYGEFSPWDEFRSLHPLLSLLFPAQQNDMILSLLDIYQQTGRLPHETMTGDHAVPILVDSWFKGIRGYDSALAYAAMIKTIVDTPFRLNDRLLYQQQGYISSDHPESVTRTVEYAYDDWALGQFASKVMKDTATARLLTERGHSYRNLFDPEELFLLPRKSGFPPENSFNKNPGTVGYKEGDKWVYSYFAPQDGRGLINLMGGDRAFTERLDSALAVGQILFDNETVFQLPYLFNQARAPRKTQQWVRTIMDTRYSDQPGGLPGNDDLGAMSAWYVLSAMGFYPLCPGRPVYAVGRPLFRRLVLHLANAKDFTVRGDAKKYTRSLEINHTPYHGIWIPHSMIAAGGEMSFTGSDTPDDRWLVNAGGRGDSFSDEARGPSKITVSGVTVSKQKVEPDERFWIRYSLTNRGETGTRIVRVFAGEKEYEHMNRLVKGGATISDSIECRLYPVGQTSLRMEGTPLLAMQVVAPRKKMPLMEQLSVGSLAFRPLLRKGEELKLQFHVKNIGGYSRAFSVPVRLDDKVVITDTVRLKPGEKRLSTVTIPATDLSGRTGWRKIGVGAVADIFKVYDRDTASLLLAISTRVNSGGQLHDHSGFSNNGLVRGSGNCDTLQDRLLFGNCYVEVPAAPSLDKMGETITMMAWIFPHERAGGYVDLFSKGDNHVLQLAGGRTLTFFAGGWGRGDCTVGLPADWVGHWHHIAGVCEGAKLYVYIDGLLKGESKVDGLVNLSVSSRWNLGRNEEFPGERIFRGTMDEMKVFAEPLTATEVSEIYRESSERFK